MRILRYDGVLLFDFTLLSTSFKIVFYASLISAINDTHMEELVLYWIQYKNSSQEFSTKMVTSFSDFYKTWVGFCLDIWKHFFLEFSF